MIRLANKNIQYDSIVDGTGLRMVLWCQGCRHNCKGCHNPHTHNFKDGFLVSIEEIKQQIDNNKLNTGITFSGGDPMEQPEELLEIAKYCKDKNLNIWCYTGYLYEDILNDSKKYELLKYIDVLVDGKFILELYDIDLDFVGSSNQRIINVRQSLKDNKIVLLKLT